MFISLIVLLIVGLIAGFAARLLVPGDDSMSALHTMVLGIAGSLVGGFLGYVLLGSDIDDGAVQASGLIGSIIGAVIALMIYRVAVQKRPAVG